MASRGRGRARSKTTGRGARSISTVKTSGSDTQRRPGSSESDSPDVSAALVKPTAQPVEGQFADVQLECAKTRQSDVITIKVSSLPLDTTMDEIGHYLESKGDNVKVLSVSNLGNGNAEVKVIGYTIKELEWLQKKEHKFKTHNVEITVVCTLPSDEPLQSVPFDSSTASPHEPSDLIIEVSGLPSGNTDTELLEIYFESSKSGGCSNAVVNCSVVADGIAHIEFRSHEVAARVFSKKDHVLQGFPLCLAYVQKPVDEPKARNKLLIRNTPPGIDREYLLLFLESVLEMEETDFTVTVLPDQLALIVFHNDFTVEELEEMVAKIEKKPLKRAHIRVELCRISRSIEISNISKYYDDDFLKMFFENRKKSGGGNVTSVDLLGNGRAIVTFEDPEVLDDVIAKNAVTKFGENAVLKRRDPFERLPTDLPAVKATTTSPIASTAVAVPLQPFTIKVNSLIAKCIQKSQEGLTECLKHLNVQQPEVDEKEGVIKIHPTNQTISGWQQECREKITSYIHSHFNKVEINFPNKAEADVRRCVMEVQDETTLVAIFNPSNTGFTAASDPSTIAMLETRIKEISLHYEQVQKEVRLTAEEYSFFTQVKALQVTGAHPNISIDYRPTDNVLLLRGSVQDVKCFEQFLPDCLHHVSIPMQHAAVVPYFSTGDGRKQLENFIKSQKTDVSLAKHFKQGPSRLELVFLCDPAIAESASAIVGALQESTKQQVHQLPRSFTSLSQADSGEYYQLCQSFEIKQHVLIVTSEDDLQVSISGFNNGVTITSQALIQFIKDKCTIVKPVDVEKGMWRLFGSLMQSKWDLIVLHCKEKVVELTVPGKTDSVILLKGDTELVEEIYQEINMLKKSVATQSTVLSRPGTCRYFKEDEKAKMLLSGIEKSQKVCIEIEEVDLAESDNEEFPHVSDSPQFMKVCVARTKEFKQITIYKGDITDYKADVIVNAANGELHHVGGVAKAIADKGGPIIQEESTQYVRRRGRLVDGDVWLTKKVGHLPCKALIHAVGPQWEGGGAKKRAHLSKAIFQSLKQASKYRSIALPAISSGVYGCPIAQCADVLVKAAVDFSEQNPLSELQEINFILFKGTNAQVFVDAIKKHLPVDNIVSEKHPVSSSLPFPSVFDTQAAVPETSRRKSKKTTRQTPIPDCIHVHRGSLLSIMADVYVNTTNTNLDLTQGAVAQTLAKAAGPSLQAECTRRAPISVGNIAVTKAGNLPSQYIIHVVAPSYDGPGGQAEKVLRILIQKCMKECTRLKVSSVAFPALGAGNLHFPSSIVAKIMVGEISSFLVANRNTALNSVHLVIYMADTHQAFLRETGSGTCKSESSPYSTSEPRKPKPKRSKKLAPTRSATPVHASLGSNITITLVNDIKLQIIHGDITDDSSDAIVNTTNSELQLSGPGVSGALLRKGGKHLQQLCDEETLQGSRLECGEVIVTPATGKLRCKSIFHTIFENPQKFVKTMKVCLQKAEELKYQSVAFPAVGTGTHGCSPQAVAREMMKAIQQFASSKHSHVVGINIVLFDAEMYQTFAKALQDTDSESSQPGLWTRTKDWFGSFMSPQSSPDQDDDAAISSPSANTVGYEEMMNRELEFKIYGVTPASVEETMEKLIKLIDEQFITSEIEDPNVGKLPQSDIAELRAKSKKMHIEMEVCGAPENCIRLKGDVAELQRLKFDILQTLSSFEKCESQRREAKNLQRIIQWKRQNSQEVLEDYDAQENYEIEQAYQSQQPTYTYNSSLEHYTLDFNKMEEKDHSSKDTCKIVRVDLEKQYLEGDRPQNWVPMPTDSSGKEKLVHLVDLQPQTEEYKKVLTEFNKTMNPGQKANTPVTTVASSLGMPIHRYAVGHRQASIHAMTVPAATFTGQGMAYNSIEAIQRVQNPTLYGQYQAKMREMEKQNPPGHKNEWLLWHGTRPDTCQKVNIQGFNRSFAGQNATVYGRGVYFARDASYSARDTYSPRDLNGSKYMYLVRVLVGEYGTGSSSMIVPPPKNPSNDPNVLFDSVVDNTSNPQVFVVFHDANAYPEYLVVFS